MINGNVVRAPVACTVSVPVGVDRGYADATSKQARQLVIVTQRDRPFGSLVIKPEPNADYERLRVVSAELIAGRRLADSEPPCPSLGVCLGLPARELQGQLSTDHHRAGGGVYAAAVKAARRARYQRLLLVTDVEQRHEAEGAAQRFGVPGR